MADQNRRDKLDLRWNSKDTERGEMFWNQHTIELKFSYEKQWIKSVRTAIRKPDYSMGELDSIHEEVCGNRLELSGPLLDSYLKEIGKGMENKLARSKATGLATPVSIFIPWLIFRHILTLIRGYGGDVENDNKQSVVVATCPLKCVKKLFSPRRFSGQNFLQRRNYSKTTKDKKSSYEISGKACVVVSKNTPFCIEYSMKKQKASTTFYIQRYDKDNYAVDLRLQSLMNND